MLFFLGILLITPFLLTPLTATEPLQCLIQGNNEYLRDDPLSKKQRSSLAKSQKPIATILTCSDSRVPPELIFNKELGELFVVRIAGNTVDQLSLASLDYGVSYLGTPLLVILGHENCGAVSAAFDLESKDFGANIGALLAQIHPSIRDVKLNHANLSKKKQLKLAIEKNVSHTHREILFRSQVIRHLVEEKKLQVKEAVFHIGSGKVTWQ